MVGFFKLPTCRYAGQEMTEPYRNGQIKPLCSSCGELADEACLRCAHPLCDEHMHADDRRCEACERSFRRRTNLGVTSLALLAQLAVSPLYVVTGWPSVDSVRWRDRMVRAARVRFLRKKRRPKAL